MQVVSSRKLYSTLSTVYPGRRFLVEEYNFRELLSTQVYSTSCFQSNFKTKGIHPYQATDADVHAKDFCRTVQDCTVYIFSRL